MSLSFAFTQVVASPGASGSSDTVPSALQNGHPRQRHIGQNPSACSLSHELLHPGFVGEENLVRPDALASHLLDKQAGLRGASALLRLSGGESRAS